jgi:hypothetical protein
MSLEVILSCNSLSQIEKLFNSYPIGDLKLRKIINVK